MRVSQGNRSGGGRRRGRGAGSVKAVNLCLGVREQGACVTIV